MKSWIVYFQKEYGYIRDVDCYALRTSLDDLGEAYTRFFKKLIRHPKVKKKKVN